LLSNDGRFGPHPEVLEGLMNKIATGALAVLTLAGALTATTALPAAAADHHWRGGGHYEGYRGYGGYRGGYYGYRGDGAAAALIGLAAGAALAGGAYYAAPPAYYYAPPCRIEMRWNPYWGGYERVRVCY
jgi:hypothetical protein